MVFIQKLKVKHLNLKTEVLSGLTVSLALVPEAVAFSLIAGISPIIGLHTAFIIGLITAVLGGRPGMISGATGAIAVVIISLVATHGIEYLFVAVVLMGLIQVLVGILKLGKFIRLVPKEVIIDFKESRVVDHSAIEALGKVTERYHKREARAPEAPVRRLPFTTWQC